MTCSIFSVRLQFEKKIYMFLLYLNYFGSNIHIIGKICSRAYDDVKKHRIIFPTLKLCILQSTDSELL